MIVVLGSTNTDMVISGAKFPVPGEPVKGADWFRGSLPIHLVAGLACLVKAGA